jgi:hypothetical protein
MKVYIDKKFMCHTENPDGLFREVEVGFFDGKCKELIEGCRYVPPGEIYIDETGEKNEGTIIEVWNNPEERYASQREYERQLLAEYEKALAEIEKALGV